MLLETKLYIPPPVGDLVARSGLYELLDQGLHQKLTLISAPAGFGKTTAAATWLRRLQAHSSPGDHGIRVAWFTVDEHDDDLHRFLQYLVAAVRGADINLLDGWIDLDRRPAAPKPEEIAAELLVELAAGQHHADTKLVLVLDDYHSIANEEIHRFVGHLLRRLIYGVHVVILTRFDPPLGMPQLRVRKEVNDVRAAQLAFTRAEAGAFFQRAVAADLDGKTIDALWQRTEGWAAGLRLTAISMHKAADRADFVRRFAQNSDRHVADYLLDQVLSSQPPDVQAFLLRTSVLERLCDELCATVAGSARYDGERMLDYLERRGLFLLPLDEFGEWYRYHPQFRTMLQSRLRSMVSVPELTGLHRAAAEWLACQGLVEEALQHCAAGRAYPEAIALLESEIPSLLRRERWRRAERWLQMLPRSEVEQRPSLLLLQAWLCHRDLNYLQVRELVAKVETLLTGQGTQGVVLRAAPTGGYDALRGQIHALRASTAFSYATLDEPIAQGQAALPLLPPEYNWVRAFAVNALSQPLAARDGLDAGLALLRTELANSRTATSEYTLRLCFAEAGLHYFQGSVEAFLHAAQRFEKLALFLDLPIHMQWANWGLGTVCLERSELQPAIERFAAVFERADFSLFQTLRLAGFGLLPLYAYLGRYGEGDEVLAILQRRLESNPDPFARAETEALDALWALLRGDLATAAAYARAASSEIQPINVPHRGIVLVRIHHALGSPEDLEQATTIAEHSLRDVRALRHVRPQITWLVLLAQTYWRRGMQVRALAHLREALVLGYPLGFRNVYTDGPMESSRLMGEMLHRLAREETFAARTGSLLAAMAHMAEAGKRLREVQQAHAPALTLRDEGETIIEPLSDRELEVLALMARKLGNKEIGQLLFISPITVRNHTVKIYDKLHVESRLEAVARARQLGMLPQA